MSDTPKSDLSDRDNSLFGCLFVIVVGTLAGLAAFTAGTNWEKTMARMKALEERVEKLEETP